MDPSLINSDVLRLIAGGDQQAFTLLFDVYSPRLHAFALRITRSESLAEEVVQEVFLNLWRHRAKLDELDHAEAYIIRTTRNVSFNILKSQTKAILRLEDQLVDDAYFLDHSTEHAIAYKESEQILQKVIEGLTPQQRHVYLLCKKDGLSYDQAASELNISSATVHYHMKEALKNIRILLLKMGFPLFVIALLIK